MKYILLLLAITLVSCDEISFHQKFDKAKWDEKQDWDYPDREEVVDDLMKHHQLKGLSYKSLVDSLGQPENLIDSGYVDYQLLMDFGSDIDPIHTKYLSLKLNKDSTVASFEISEWKKGN